MYKNACGAIFTMKLSVDSYKTFEDAINPSNLKYLEVTEEKTTEVDAVEAPSSQSKYKCVFLFDEWGKNLELSEEEDHSHQMLLKMVEQFKLPKEQYCIDYCIGPRTTKEALLNKLVELGSSNIVTFGAQVLKLLRDDQLVPRISKVHGQMFQKEHEGRSFNITPLFHPLFLRINPSMKKATWDDMKKLIIFIHKCD